MTDDSDVKDILEIAEIINFDVFTTGCDISSLLF